MEVKPITHIWHLYS